MNRRPKRPGLHWFFLRESIATNTKANFESAKAKQKRSSKKSKLFAILSHGEQGKAHQQQPEEYKGKLKL